MTIERSEPRSACKPGASGFGVFRGSSFVSNEPQATHAELSTAVSPSRMASPDLRFVRIVHEFAAVRNDGHNATANLLDEMFRRAFEFTRCRHHRSDRCRTVSNDYENTMANLFCVCSRSLPEKLRFLETCQAPDSQNFAQATIQRKFLMQAAKRESE